MKTQTLSLLVACALGLGACGGDDEPVPGTTVPTAATQPDGAAPGPSDQANRMKSCLGGEQVTRVDVFEPTYELARSQGGAGFALMLGPEKAPKQVEFIVFPDAATAQVGFEDAQNRLIELQQQKPEQYAQIAATAMQVVENVLEIVPTGAPSPKVNGEIVGCVQQSRAAT